MPHNYIIWIAQWALQNQSVKKKSAVQKRIEEKKFERKGKKITYDVDPSAILPSPVSILFLMYILTLCPQHILEHICGNWIQFF